MSMQQFAVVTAQPAVVIGLPTVEREWNSGICDCCQDCESCCLTLFFPWCYVCCCLSKDMDEHCCTPFCVPDVILPYRVKMRARHHIAGSIICDCCCCFWCCPCTVCQLAREIKYIEKTTGRKAFL